MSIPSRLAGSKGVGTGSEPRAPMKTSSNASGNHKRGGSYRPLAQRLQLYDEVLLLRKQRLCYNEIIDKVYRLLGERITATHISDWVRGLHAPLGRVNKFDGKPSPELAGIIGVVLSDGNRNLHGNHSYRMWLGVKDKDYAEAFSHDLAAALGKNKPYKLRWSRNKRRWITEAGSILLYRFLDRPWQELRPYVEANKVCVARFLRRFFDGEGSIEGRTLNVYNTNRELLLYIRLLLQRYFGIETTGPHRGTKAGSHLKDPKSGQTYKRKKNCYSLYVQAKSLSRFHQYVGFTIKRKQQRLIEAIQK